MKYGISDNTEAKVYGSYYTEEAANDALQEWLAADDDRDGYDFDVCELHEKFPPEPE